MGPTVFLRSARRCAGHLMLVLLLGGCGAGISPPSSPAVPEPAPDAAAKTLSLLPPDSPVEYEAEPNDKLFDPFRPQARAADGFRVLAGLDAENDVDVYALGGVEAGDELSVRINSPGGAYLQAALFDADGRLLTLAEWQEEAEGNTVVVDHVARWSSPDCVLAVSAYGPGYNALGGYEIALRSEPVDIPPYPPAQNVLLNFYGGQPDPEGRFSNVEIAPFEAAAISTQWSDETGAIVARTVEMVRENFAGLGVVVYDDPDELPPGEPFSTVHVGAPGNTAFGLAEAIDEYNANPNDEAILYVESFSYLALLSPSPEQIATALANVITHETGHLLGLRHTADAKSVMDVTASLGQLLLRRSFGTHPLDAGTFPLGQQDDVALLEEAVGGELALVGDASTHPTDAKSGRTRGGRQADQAVRPLPLCAPPLE